MAPSPGVSVVMVVYRTGPALFRSIAAVLAEPLVEDFVVVDNGSDPADEAELQEIAAREPRLRLVQGQGNVGFARGCNLGAAAAYGSRLLILNPDAYIQPDCIEALIEGARVLNTDGSEQRGARRGEFTPLRTLLNFAQLSGDLHMDDQPVPDGPLAVPTISGSCFYVSREDFERLGGFDEGYFLHVEDIDLCWRARRAGGSVVFQPKAVVLHEGSTSQSLPLRVELHKGRGFVRYFIKRADTLPQRLLAWGLSPLIMLLSVARPLLRGLSGPARGRLS
jgi:hypothetical protein